ncbi:DUF2750 domain-containing protein [Mucilaginibacter glaciei]|uniref:DUF2750 domain-containing protein n=1 Tax=Mucilaginibacter glaciei TaxID=2772109 RepID=A0A926S0R1_9SPHI|nr:DUF2750 domain-containing protein [Mucilaginibacter glaciei]MBD1393235.1 DUF2750 domain-containing protein [Mucilaginibacter glaciei]
MEDTTDIKYTQFIEKVAATKLVWGLKSKTGWANTESAEDEEVGVVPFWSDRALAKISARDEWKSYVPTEVPLAIFLEDWCVGMAENETLIGINFDAKMLGTEAEPELVVFDILTRLKAINSAIKFTNYISIDEFITEISEEQ